MNDPCQKESEELKHATDEYNLAALRASTMPPSNKEMTPDSEIEVKPAIDIELQRKLNAEKAVAKKRYEEAKKALGECMKMHKGI